MDGNQARPGDAPRPLQADVLVSKSNSSTRCKGTRRPTKQGEEIHSDMAPSKLPCL